MTNQQQAVYDVLSKHGPCSSLHLGGLMRREYPRGAWTLDMVRKVLSQLKYRSLVEHDRSWQVVPSE